MELSWLPKRGSYYANTWSKLYAMLEPLLVFSSFSPSSKQWLRGSFYRPGSLLVEGACKGVKTSGGRQNRVVGGTHPQWTPWSYGGRHPWLTAFAPDGPDDLPRLVSCKTRVAVPLCHVLEDHDPCDNMLWPLDQTDIALDALDGFLKVSRGSMTWLAMQGVAPARWAQQLPPWHGTCHPGWPMWHQVWWFTFQVGPFCSFSYYFLHINKFVCTCGTW